MSASSGNWLIVASAEDVRIGQASGFMQVCHGKADQLRFGLCPPSERDSGLNAEPWGDVRLAA